MQEQRINKYNKYVVAEDFLLVTNYNSVMELPFFLRAVINTSSKEYLIEKRQSINALVACFLLSGQKTIPTRAKKSIAGFKLRENALIGCRTTLRKKRLYTILDKLLIFVLPRLYSEKKNNTIFKISNLLFLKTREKTSKFLQTQENQVTAKNKTSYFFREEGFNLDQTHPKHTEIISQQERSQLSMFLRKSGECNKNSIAKNEKIVSKGQINYLALGIKDLLLMPELQEFLPLFDTVRGINIGVSFSSPKIKGTCLTTTFFFKKQKFALQNLVPQALGEKVLKDCTHPHTLSKEINEAKKNKGLFNLDQFAHFTYNTVEHKEKKERVTLSFEKNHVLKSYGLPCNPKTIKTVFQKSTYKRKEEETCNLLNKEYLESVNINNSQQESKDRFSKKKESLLKKIKSTFTQKQNIERKHTFYIQKDTPYSKEDRKTFFLTCFQYPGQYN